MYLVGTYIPGGGLKETRLGTTYKVFDRALVGAQHNGRRVVRQLALGLCVYPHQAQLLPHRLHQLVNVPTVLGADGHRVGDPVQQVQLLDRDRVDLVEHVDDGDIAAAARLEDVNQVVDGRVAADGDVGRVDAVLAHDGADLVVVNVRQRHRVGDVETALVLLLECDVGRRLVDADTKALQLLLDHALVRQRLIDVEHDEDQMARLSHGNDLATTTTTILGTLNDTGQVDHLQWRAIVRDLAGHTRQGGEFVGGGLGVLAGQATHERTLADGRETDETDTGDTRTGNVETRTTASTARGRHQQFTLQLGELGFELAEMVRSGLVLLCPGHLVLHLLNLFARKRQVSNIITGKIR